MLADHPEALLQHLGMGNVATDSDNSTHPGVVLNVTEEDRAAIERASIIYYHSSVFFC